MQEKLGLWLLAEADGPDSSNHCPMPTRAEREARKTPCSLALSLAGKKKRFSTSPRTLGVTDRGDRIRTCDLVLPKIQTAPAIKRDLPPELAL